MANRLLLDQHILDEILELKNLGVPLTKILKNKNIPKIHDQTIRRLLKHYETALANEDNKLSHYILANLFPYFLDEKYKDTVWTYKGIFKQINTKTFIGTFPLGHWEDSLINKEDDSELENSSSISNNDEQINLKFSLVDSDEEISSTDEIDFE